MLITITLAITCAVGGMIGLAYCAGKAEGYEAGYKEARQECAAPEVMVNSQSKLQ